MAGMTGWLSSTLWPRSWASTSVSIWQHKGTDSCEASAWPYPTIDLAATGAHIRQLRLEQGYSVQDLQIYLGLEHPQAIYHWQHGRNLPSVDNLYALSKLWGVPMDKIIVEQAA
ncbi:MAG: helix-turn-helix domain-containing protein [Dysosmobacter sp.]